MTFGVVCHRVSSGWELLSVAPALQSSEQSALHAAILIPPVSVMEATENRARRDFAVLGEGMSVVTLQR
jgi:hypothetical protein